MHSDQRVYSMRYIKGAGVHDLVSYIHPRIYPLHKMHTDLFSTTPLSTQDALIPQAVRASFTQFERGGVYLVENGQAMYLWISRDVEPSILQELFGMTRMKLTDLNPRQSNLPLLQNDLSIKTTKLIEYIRQSHPSKYLCIQLARQALDGAEHEIAALLVEDMNNNTWSFVDFLVFLHKQIQLQLMTGKIDDSSWTSKFLT